ncbi:hypothetical protein QEH42_gp201 [Microbacterium phage Pumpernickel]|uniref:Uncharacterized protein n=1 Tax=Microbacterium phage Pumpernickel TaxID=2885983 RepID=A0AAE8YA40_9CAUD|nr:hypothetical protein QEH42_gp201 [Microbacterium phage Pumpernickel]UDL16017.1 hypothetical protein SEA_PUMPERNICKEL_267 [Microbacterium phage Pumpernickel]
MKGDWVTASAGNGCSVVGQSLTGMDLTGNAIMDIWVQGDGGPGASVTINVNYWDVEVLYPDLVSRGNMR